MRFRTLYCALAAALAVSGISRGQQVSSGVDSSAPVSSIAAETAPKQRVSDPGYLLQPDDVIEVTVFREPDLTTAGMVRRDGFFDMKLIGAVNMAHLTVDQATEVIRAALAKDYLINPRVNIGMVEYAKKKIDILGEVRSPGVYPFPPRGPFLLSDAVALAGGFLPSADVARVVVNRIGNGRTATLEVDASSSAGVSSFSLEPDDAISVGLLPRRHFTVLGQINRPGAYDLSDNRPLYLTDAIAMAGGFTRLANSSHVFLKRTEKGRETVLELNAKAMANSPDTQRLEIQNEDTITVPESMF